LIINWFNVLIIKKQTKMKMKFLLVGGFTLLANSFMAQSTVVNDSIGKSSSSSISRVSSSILEDPWVLPTGTQFTMPIAAIVKKNGVLSQPDGQYLGIFKNNICQGYTILTEGPVGLIYVLTAMYSTNNVPGFTFKVYDSYANQYYDVVETVTFVKNTSIGNADVPKVLNLKFAITKTTGNALMGSVSGTANGSFTSNQAVSVTATPTTGNRFVNWTDGVGGTVMSTNAVYAFNASENRNLIANFAANYNVTATSNNDLLGSVTGAGYIVPGQPVTLTATPISGKRFIKWTVAGVTVSTSATYTFTPNANKTLVANFDIISGTTITAPTATSSDITTNSDVVINNGSTVSIDASKEVYSLTVTPGAKIDLTQPLTVVGDVTFKADQDKSFSIKIESGMTVSGTVRYVKTMNDNQWYFMSFPCNVTISEISQVGGTGLGLLGTDWFINYYDGASRITNLGATSNWKDVNVATPTHLNTLTLTANQGYIFGLKTGVGTKDLAFILDKALVAARESDVRTIPVVAYGDASAVAENHKGWNLVGQPYLSRFKGANAGGMTHMTLPVGTGATYSQELKADVTSIDPFSAYFVQADAALETTGIDFALAGRQLVASTVEINQIVFNFISLAQLEPTKQT